MWTRVLPVGLGSVRKNGRDLGNPLVEKSALAVAGTPSAVGVCWRISGGVMHHESACKSEFRVRFPEWGPASVAQSVERVAVKPPAGWWTKNVAYARVRVPSGAVLGPGR